MYSNYHTNKANAVFRNTEPSMTDQSQAKFTDINLIVKKIKETGLPPPSNTVGQYLDMSGLPNNLRDMIEMSRTISDHYDKLPPQLKKMPVEQLLALTPADIKKILTPPPKEESK